MTTSFLQKQQRVFCAGNQIVQLPGDVFCFSTECLQSWANQNDQLSYYEAGIFLQLTRLWSFSCDSIIQGLLTLASFPWVQAPSIVAGRWQGFQRFFVFMLVSLNFSLLLRAMFGILLWFWSSCLLAMVLLKLSQPMWFQKWIQVSRLSSVFISHESLSLSDPQFP